MFKKLLANLPFNPGMLDEVAFYAHRLRTESQTRKLGLIFLALAIVVQTAAGLYPAEKSLATGKHKDKPAAVVHHKPPKKTPPPAPPSPPPATIDDIKLEKSVSNLTKDVWDANGSTASKGDILEFKMTAKNTVSGGFFNYSGEDFFGYVLQYADIADSKQLEDQGIIVGEDGYLRWETGFIAGKASDTKVIKVKIKENIPMTNKPDADSQEYNCTISNEYGNSVSVSVPCPPIKVAAETAAELPKTGPGVSVALGGLVAGLAGYLFARTRMMAKELEIVRRDHISAGGGR